MKQLKVGEWEQVGNEAGVGGERREKSRDLYHRCSPTGLERGENQVAICISCSPEEQRDTLNVPARVVGTKPSDRGRNEAQRCHCLVAPIVRQNKPGSLASSLHPSRGSSGPRRSYSPEHWAIKHIICEP